MDDELRPDVLPSDLAGTPQLDSITDEQLGAENLDAEIAPRLLRYRGDVEAEWAMRRLVGAQTRIIENTLLFTAWVEKIEAWYDEVTKADRRIVERTDLSLVMYAIAERTRTRDERKTVKLPSGTISTTKGTKPVVEITDEKAVLVWAADSLDGDTYDVVAPSHPKVLVSELRKVVRIHERDVEGDDGPETETVVLDTDGNVVPGVVVVPPRTTAKVQPAASPALPGDRV